MKRVLLIGLTVIACAGGLAAWHFYNLIKGPATRFTEASRIVLLDERMNLDALAYKLQTDSIIASAEDFIQVAGLKSFKANRPGRYQIAAGASLNRIINQLRAGIQAPVYLSFPGYRTSAQLAGRVSAQIQADSADIAMMMKDPEIANQYGFDEENFRCMFIPNTYECWYTTDAREFIDRLSREYESFWTDERKEKATQRGLSPKEVSILASIVKAETAMRDEAPKVAGLYLNRLRIGMALQADPTLIYAIGDFSIKRVLDIHKEVQSPYNTYLHTGLPPGPINFPEPHYIDAVLNAADHDYFYMCAKPDFSGYHNFSKTLRQHNQYANQYRRALSREMRKARRQGK